MSDARISDGQKNLQGAPIDLLVADLEQRLHFGVGELRGVWLLRCVKSGLVSGIESTG